MVRGVRRVIMFTDIMIGRRYDDKGSGDAHGF